MRIFTHDFLQKSWPRETDGSNTLGRIFATINTRIKSKVIALARPIRPHLNDGKRLAVHQSMGYKTPADAAVGKLEGSKTR